MDPWAEFLSTLRLTDLGASGLVAITVLLILMGRLVPKSVADAWKDAYFKEKEAGQIKDQQVADLAAAARVSARALDALPRATGGEPDVATTEETAPRGRQG